MPLLEPLVASLTASPRHPCGVGAQLEPIGDARRAESAGNPVPDPARHPGGRWVRSCSAFRAQGTIEAVDRQPLPSTDFQCLPLTAWSAAREAAQASGL